MAAWKKFSPFQVFGDYAPMDGFRLVVQVGIQPGARAQMLESRAGQSATLDPDLAQWCLRAGLGLARSGLVSFIYATAEDTLVLVRPEATYGAGRPVDVQNQLLTLFTSRMSLLSGQEIPAEARLYEFPDLAVVRRAFTALAEDFEESTPLRSSIWLGAQLRGRGQPFHPSMIESLEEQTSLLQSNGVDMDALPAWWWRGVAARVDAPGEIQIFDELPGGDAFADLMPEE